MNFEARIKALRWLLKQLDMGIARTGDAEVQIELANEKLRYVRELKELEARPRQAVLFDTTEEAGHLAKVAED